MKLRSRIPFLLSVVLAAAGSAVAQTPPDAAGSWWQRAPAKRVGQYWVKTDLPAKRANALSRHLNLMYAEYSRRLASLPQRTPESLNVLIFQSRAEYQIVLRRRYGIDASGTGGMFFVNELGTGLAFWTGDLPATRVHHVLQHEGFHQFAWSRFGGDLPIWVNEGLAEFFGEAVLVGSRLVIGQSTPRVIDAVKLAIDSDETIPFGRMLTMDGRQWRLALERPAAPLQYHQAWSMVHFLVYGDGGRYTGAFETYLRHLNQGVLSEEAFRRAFGADIGAFEKQWKRYALSARPSAFRTALDRIEFLAEGALALSIEGVVPASLDELKAALIRVGYERSMSRHGVDTIFRADSPETYTIPVDDRVSADESERRQPVFVVEPLNVNRLTRRERLWEERMRTPPAIRTSHLVPYELQVRWQRDRETGDLRGYEIEIRR